MNSEGFQDYDRNNIHQQKSCNKNKMKQEVHSWLLMFSPARYKIDCNYLKKLLARKAFASSIAYVECIHRVELYEQYVARQQSQVFELKTGFTCQSFS